MTETTKGAVGAETKTAYWRCPECGCHSYAHVQEQKGDGSFGPGPKIRCVNCKAVWMHKSTLASPRADSDERTASEDVPLEAVRGILEASATPAQPAGAVPDSLRAAFEAAELHECWVNGDTADVMTNPYGHCGNFDQIVARCATGDLWRKRAVAIAESLNFVRSLLASHPAGQSVALSGESSFGARLKRLREGRDESLQDVASAIGGTKAHLWSLEQGRSCNPSLDLLKALSGHFGVTVAHLIGEVAEQQRPPCKWVCNGDPAQPPAREEAEDDDTPRCEICDKALIAGQHVMQDVELGTVHAACCGPEREAYVKDVDTGEPLGPNDPIPQGYVYKPDLADGPSVRTILARLWCQAEGNDPDDTISDAGHTVLDGTLGSLDKKAFVAIVEAERAILKATTPPGAPRYQYREIGEGEGWRDCSRESYLAFASDPHIDTREIKGHPAGQSAGSGAEDLDARLKAAGMFTIPEMMGETPMTRWEVYAGMTDLDAFDRWLEMKVAEYLRMRAAYALGDKDKSDPLYEWVMAHSCAFQMIRTNFRAALPAAPEARGSTRQPIETAPKDRSQILLFGALKGSRAKPSWFIGAWFPIGEHGEGWWVSSCVEVIATEWAPLPAPPASSSQKD